MSESYYGLIEELKDAATGMQERDEDGHIITLLLEAADALRKKEREVGSLTYKYNDCLRHCERYYIELDGIVKSMQPPYRMGVAPMPDNVGSEVRRRLEELRNG
jgi:hypothetical protein